MLRCPQCGSTRIDQNMSFYGPMICLDCWFRVEDKTVKPNPFYVETDEEAAAKAAAAAGPSLGEAMAKLAKASPKAPAAEPGDEAGAADQE